jgi:hypothetical protein
VTKQNTLRRGAAPFERLELSTPWQRFTRNAAVRISSVTIVMVGTGVLIYLALAETL